MAGGIKCDDRILATYHRIFTSVESMAAVSTHPINEARADDDINGRVEMEVGAKVRKLQDSLLDEISDCESGST